MDILNRTGRALQAFLSAYPEASAEMRRGMETTMLMLASVTKNSTYHNLHLVMLEQEQQFIGEKYKLTRQVADLRQQLAKARRELAQVQSHRSSQRVEPVTRAGGRRRR